MSAKRRSSRKRARRPRSETAPAGRSAPSRAAPASGGAPTIPGWLPWALFLGLTVFLFRAFIFSDAMLYGSDTLSGGYMARAIYAGALAALGRIPGWIPQFLGGTPFVEALSGGDSFYPPSFLLLILVEPYRALGWKLVVHVAAAGFFMFLWVRALGVSRAAALVAGTGYMLAPVFVGLVFAGHDGKMFVTALTPLLFWATERHFLRPGLRSFTWLALVIALVILTPHFQMAYFLFGATGLFAIFRSIQVLRGTAPEAVPPADDRARDASPADPRRGSRSRAALRFGLFLAASIVGALIAGGQLLPAIDYVTADSRRTATSEALDDQAALEWSSSWSLHPEEAFSLVIPEFSGANISGTGSWADNTYWGRNPFKHNHEYAGLVLLLLAAISFVGGPLRGLRWFLAGLAGAAVLFALGANTPVWRITYEVLPGISLFRAPSQAAYLFAFGASTLAALGVDRIFACVRDPEQGRRVQRWVLIATAALAAVALLAAAGALTSLWTSVIYPGITEAKRQALAAALPYIGTGAWIAVLLAGSLSALVWALRKRYVAPGVVLGALVALVVLDAYRIDRVFIQTIDFERWAAPDANIQAVLDREAGSSEPYRMLSFRNAGQDLMPALHGIELAGGHHPNDLARYRHLIGMVGSGQPMNLYGSENIRRLLNVRYLLWPDLQMGSSPRGNVLSRTQLPDGRAYETVFVEAGLPRARLVGSAVVKSDDEAMPYMLSPEFDPVGEVVLAEPPPVGLPGVPVAGEVDWLERGPDRMRLAVRSSAPALLTIADNWYPAWHARVNGSDAPVLRAYHTLRAVPVPAGESEVELWYRSDVVARSFWLGFIILAGLLAANAVAVWSARRAAGSAKP
jgi:hypothetical protein